ncbi:zinc finger C2HC domain-containing protein 1C [Xyrauchen texanus]|uniref:zinc finger C2HC domain-containing protein 1C n=1 Tax=Xyrauchen texanus TaxID=154827 RepID=UPI002241E21A|nr:zinc finger C2HC domain-containing protein 1C [Xyrauchen texanus]
MQMVPHHHLAHNLWEKETLSSKLPVLCRMDMSQQRNPSGTRYNSKSDMPEDQEKQMSSMRERQHPDNMFLEEPNEYVPSRRASEVEKVFPLKPVLHKRAYSLSNVTNSEYRERFYTCLPRLNVRQQEKFVRKPDAFNSTYHQTSTRRTDLKNEHQEPRISEKRVGLSKEIHSKEMMLQQKIFKAEETVRRLQRERSSRQDSAMGDERNTRYLEKEANKCYSDGYGDWEEKSVEQDRYGNKKREIRDDMERWAKWERENGGQAESRGRRRPLPSSEMANLKMVSERAMGWDTRDKRDWRNVEEVKETYDRRRDMQDLWNVRKPASYNSRRLDRPHLEQEHFTNELKGERRENKEGLYQTPSKDATGSRRKSAIPERKPSQRERNRLQQVELSLDESQDAPHHLVMCGVCQRHFSRDRLETHMRVCERKRPQRKIFDMSQHRAKGTELEKFMKTNRRSKSPELKKNNWRQKHEAFIQTMRQGRGEEPQSVSVLNSEYVTCPHCGRRFAPGPAERHIPMCQNIRSRPPPPKQLPITTRRKMTH